MKKYLKNEYPILFTTLIIIFILKIVFFIEISKSTDLLDFNHEPGFDMLQFQKMAESQVNKGIFDKDSFGQFAPFYSFFIGVVYQIFDVNYQIIIFFQIALSLATLYFFYQLLRIYFQFHYSILGTILFGFYSVFWVYDLFLIRPVILTFHVILFLYYSLFLLYENKKNFHFLVYGIIFAFGFLIRENQILYFPVTVYVLLNKFNKDSIKKIVFFIIGSGILIIPFLIRYYITYEEIGFSPISSTNVWKMGNSADSDGVKTDIKGKLLPLISADWLLLLIKKSRTFFSGYHIPNNVDYYLVKNHSNLILLFYSNFGIYFSFGLMGIILSIKNWKKYILHYYIIFVSSFSFIIFMVFSRYRLPLIPLFIFFSIYFIKEILSAMKKKSIKKISLYMIIALILIYTFGDFQKIKENPLGSWHTFLYANILKKNSKIDLALKEYENSSIKSKNPTLPAFIELSRLYLKEKKLQRAHEVIENLIKIEPNYPDGIYMMAVISYHKKDYHNSLYWYRKFYEITSETNKKQIITIIQHLESILDNK